jgi:DNA-binding NarL/FixJ family response regulator
MKFLVVDDQNAARRMLQRIVSNDPLWSVVGEAANGLEAIASMDQRPDVVLMDLIMPLMDGLEATRQIKLLAPDTVVILTTAYQNHEFGTRSLNAGADGFVLKDDLTTEALHRILNGTGKTGKKGGSCDG